MTADLIFEEPPTAGTRHGGPKAGTSPIGLWLKELRNHPGVWAKWHHPCSGMNGTVIRRGTGFDVAAGEFETRTVKIDGDASRRTLYVRYVGGES